MKLKIQQIDATQIEKCCISSLPTFIIDFLLLVSKLNINHEKQFINTTLNITDRCLQQEFLNDIYFS